MIGKKLLDLLYPRRCLICGKTAALNEDGVCAQCGDAAAGTAVRNFAVRAGKIERILECRAPWQYRGPIRGAIYRFKFHGEHSLAPVFAKQMCAAARPLLPADAVVPVPISAERLLERGYDQSLLLAEALSRELGIPCRELLLKTRHNATQHELPRKEREANVRGVYRADPAAQGLRVLLVDDIVTTGATVRSAAGALLLAGAVRVSVCALAVSS